MSQEFNVEDNFLHGWIEGLGESTKALLHPKKWTIFPLSCSAFPQGPDTIEQILTAVKETMFFNQIRELLHKSHRCTSIHDSPQSAPTHSLHHTLSHTQENQQVCWNMSLWHLLLCLQCNRFNARSWSFSLLHTHMQREGERDLVQCFKSSTTEKIDFLQGS